MATTYEKTDNLGLNLYGDNDPADLRDGYNGSMQTLDTDIKQVQDNVDKTTTAVNNLTNIVATKISKVAHDDTLTGDGTTTTPLKVKLNHSTVMRDTGNTVYPTLLKAQTGTTINGIGFNAGDGLTAYNTEDEDTGSGIRLSDETQTSIENSEQCLTTLTANTTNSATKLLSRIRQEEKIVLFGDSWTTYDSGQLATSLGAIKNYGVGSAKIQDLASQATTAKNDTTVDKNTVTHVIVVAGTNNVYHDNDITINDAATAFKAIKQVYPYAEVHYFPNNSCTANGGRNERYYRICYGAETAGVITHPDSIRLMWWDNYAFYRGTDVIGVQHLTAQGATIFADIILNTIRGGSTPLGYRTNVYIDMSVNSSSTIITTSTPRLSYYIMPNGMTRLKTTISNLNWASGATEANKKKPFMLLDIPVALTGHTAPILTDFQCMVARTNRDDVLTAKILYTNTPTQQLGFVFPQHDTEWTLSTLYLDTTFFASTMYNL